MTIYKGLNYWDEMRRMLVGLPSFVGEVVRCAVQVRSRPSVAGERPSTSAAGGQLLRRKTLFLLSAICKHEDLPHCLSLQPREPGGHSNLHSLTGLNRTVHGFLILDLTVHRCVCLRQPEGVEEATVGAEAGTPR